MPVTKDIGGGNQIVDVGGIYNDVLGAAEKQLGLIDLQNKIAQAPAELAKKQADAILASHQVAQMGVQDQMQLADLNSKIQTEKRAALDAKFKFFTSLPAVAAIDPAMAVSYLQQGAPGSSAKIDENGGIISAFVPDGNEIRTMTIPLRRITDPEKAIAIATDARKQLEGRDEYKGFGIVNEFYKNFKGSMALDNGVGDMSATFSWIKMHDRQGRVQEAQEVSAKDAPGVTQNLLNWYNGNIRLGQRGARYGEMNSATRKDFINVADDMYSHSRAAALQQMQFYGKLYDPSTGVNNRAVVPLLGDITEQEVFGGGAQKNIGASGEVPDGRQSSALPKRPGATEAGVLPTGQNPEANKPPTAGELPVKPSQQLDMMTGQLLAPLFQRKAKRARPY